MAGVEFNLDAYNFKSKLSFDAGYKSCLEKLAEALIEFKETGDISKMKLLQEEALRSVGR